MKTILVPTDFSAEADVALDVAVNMSNTFNSDILLVNIAEVPGGNQFSAQGTGAGGSSINDLFAVKLIERIKSQLKERVEKYPQADITSEIAVGDIHEMLNERIDVEEVDLVIMGTQGSEGLREVMIGSNAERIVRGAKCPVLTVREENKEVHPKNIVFASDFTEEYGPVAKRLKNFQEMYNAQLHLLFVNTPNKFELSSDSNKRMRKFADKYGIENYTINVYNHRDEEDGILGFAEEFDHDLISVATHSRKGIAHLLSGSIAEGIVNHSHKPVLSFSLKYLK